ncbi:uncharacterized protein LOC133792320 [Humulus lupulus]|uniref:uncharacterized protein LOC133792320 n=1 Tax=Humulus lupulus TaxID=3486 RepID=UPI002B404F64|nr:uncharacterized protein LOC133792320 [Humulus lupulus]
MKVPENFTIPCTIGNTYCGMTLRDLGASINLMPMSVFRQLGIGEVRPTTVTLQLANQSLAHPNEKIEDVLVKVDKFIFPAAFIVLDYEADREVPIILGRHFLAIGRTLIDVQKGVYYVSKWVEAVASPNNDSKVVMKAIISDEGTHFVNKLLASFLAKYDVRHKVVTAYHPQTNGQDKLSNKEIKRVLEKVVNPNCKDWSKRLEDALWGYRTTFKMTLGMSPCLLVFGKACHLLVELEHRAYWIIQILNVDLQLAMQKRMFYLNELDEMSLLSCENAKLYKEKTKKWHEKNI